MSTDREREALARLIDPAAFDVPAFLRDARRIQRRGIALQAADRVIAAGWMPRPEPGTEAWSAMVDRAARAIGIRLGYEGRLLDAYMPEGRLLALAALRAALGTGERE